MKSRTLSYATSVVLGLCLAHSVPAQDSHWNGTVGNNLWNDPNNWNPAGVPPSVAQGLSTSGGNVWLDPSPVDGDSVMTIPAGDVEMPGIGGAHPPYNTIYGPEFGCTLNIYGTLTFDWTIAPYQPDPTPGMRSHINIHDNGYMYTSGASLNLGSGWWPVCEGAYVTMNLYSNANYSSLGGAGFWAGGHVNIYDTSTFLINGYVNINNGQANNDATVILNVGGGTLMFPEGTTNSNSISYDGIIPDTGSIYTLIQQGILRAYGKGYDTNDLVISDNGTNAIVTAVPLGGALQRVYFQPMVRPTVTVGVFQQAMLVGDYPSVGGVLLSSDEPGVDPATFAAPVYASSNPNVATVDANGMVTAIGVGTATLTATVGAFNSTNSVTITVNPVVPNLVHEYKFNETSGTTAADSKGSANGTLNGDAAFSGTGQLLLSGNQGSSVILPPGILGGFDEVTIETWVTFPSSINPFANLFAFGGTDTNALDPNQGFGYNYITFSPHTGGSTMQANFGQGLPGFNGERDAVLAGVLDNQTNVHVVVVFHPSAGYEAFYINGGLAASISMFNCLVNPSAVPGPAFTNHSVLNYQLANDPLNYGLGPDPLNYIGQSLYTGDPGLLASIDEFRIYNNALTPAQIAADYALGPNQLLGTSTSVSLSASVSGGNVTLKWPTTSALVTLLSSPSLGVGAIWTPVNTTNGALTVVGGNYQVTVPDTGTAQFFRLQQ
jgi:hypothetical protein